MMILSRRTLLLLSAILIPFTFYALYGASKETVIQTVVKENLVNSTVVQLVVTECKCPDANAACKNASKIDEESQSVTDTDIRLQPEQIVRQWRPKISVLCWVTYRKYLTMMDRWYFHICEEMARHPDIKHVRMWGPDWPDYNATLGVEKNVRARNETFDVIFSECQTLGAVLPEAIVSTLFGETVPQEGGAKNIYWLSEILKYQKLDVIFFPCANDMVFYSNYSSTRSIVHLPHGVREVFYKPVESQRNITVLLTGSLYNRYYPFRNRLARLLRERSIGYVRPHPGYTENWSEEQLKGQKLDPSKIAQQPDDYAAQLGDSQIILCTRSTRGYSLRKYTESAIAGALVMGNIPESDRTDEFRRYVVEIEEDWSNDTIVETINWWLSHPKERLERAKLGQQIAMQYTWDKVVEKMYKSFIRHIFFDQRGMDFSWQFYIDPQRPFLPERTKE